MNTSGGKSSSSSSPQSDTRIGIGPATSHDRTFQLISELLHSELVRRNLIETVSVIPAAGTVQRPFAQPDEMSGVDLLWTVRRPDAMRRLKIIVEHDYRSDTSDFFFDFWTGLVDRGDAGFGRLPGRFLSSQAHLLFYYFSHLGLLYCLPLGRARKWLLANKSRFAELDAPEDAGFNRGTVGSMVPVKTVLSEVRGIRLFHLNGGEWRMLSSNL